ncbi:hypothetical protein [Amycolatopsis eburnea]|uniref:Phosphomannomutase n=1 Tax=Amycolatopsis eburnea TaxID=2267691 RepID=A0A3R9DID9_9PSEU|nr:hypothetical protein [Amycolatopsis eburnea]RSD16363.1 hypothetical protein EIY87_22185 [Amycolatopsis eburnea]
MQSTPTTTDGWRGQTGPSYAEPQLLGALDLAVARGVLHGTVLVGYDGRAGAHDIAHLAADLLAARGATAVLADSPAPTPGVGRYVHQHSEFDAGIVVTASHNPPGYLGIKLRDHRGHGITTLLESAVLPDVTETFPVTGGLHQHAPVLGAYAATVGSALIAAARQFEGTVVIDAAHGAVGMLGPHLPDLTWRRARPLPFFAGHTPDPARRPAADAIAARLLSELPERDRAVIAMVDGDGDRLALWTTRSGYIGSAEQAAILLRSGLRPARVVTTAVSPQSVIRTARDCRVKVELVPVGFKHVVAAWHRSTDTSMIGLEPNGALVVAEAPDVYVERDSLTALTTMLTALPTLEHLDRAVTELRRSHPHPQRIITVVADNAQVISRVSELLSTWDTSTTADDVALFGNDRTGEYLAVRASGTEPGTRLYLETTAATSEKIMAAVSAHQLG